MVRAPVRLRPNRKSLSLKKLHFSNYDNKFLFSVRSVNQVATGNSFLLDLNASINLRLFYSALNFLQPTQGILK